LLVINDLRENRFHDIKDTGAYEWWYFDCIDEDNEYSFVAIFLVGNPFSPEYSERIKNHIKFPESEKPDPMDYCAVSFNLYFQDRVLYRILYEYENDMFKTEQERGNEKISIERNNFYFDRNENKYYLNINLPEPDSNNNFKAEFIFTVISDRAILKSPGSEKRVTFSGYRPLMSAKFLANLNFIRILKEQRQNSRVTVTMIITGEMKQCFRTLRTGTGAG